MTFVIKFAFVRGHYLAIGFEISEQIYRLADLAVEQFFMTFDIFDVTFAGTAAAVAVAVYQQSFGNGVLFGIARVALEYRERGSTRIVVA